MRLNVGCVAGGGVSVFDVCCGTGATVLVIGEAVVIDVLIESVPGV